MVWSPFQEKRGPVSVTTMTTAQHVAVTAIGTTLSTG